MNRITAANLWRARGKNLPLRNLILRAIRLFFLRRHYLEVETPYLIPAPAPEIYIDAYALSGLYLHTSPELAMKRLLALGYHRIFQICKCFRQGEKGAKHLPEFTLLEWYRVGSNYISLMEECEAMLASVFGRIGREKKLLYQGQAIDLSLPWERLTVEDAFREFAPLSLGEVLKRDCFDEAMAVYIEPHLGVKRPTFLYDYPYHPGSLARRKEKDPSFVERFELYIGGLELINGFTELTDPEEQRIRFCEARKLREQAGKDPYPLAERFLSALAAVPEAAGAALGIDRLTMLAANSDHIEEVVAFTGEEL